MRKRRGNKYKREGKKYKQAKKREYLNKLSSNKRKHQIYNKCYCNFFVGIKEN